MLPGNTALKTGCLYRWFGNLLKTHFNLKVLVCEKSSLSAYFC